MSSIVPVPDVEVNYVPVKSGETFQLGVNTLRVLEDGSRTDNRLSTCELILPPKTSGPPPHWHEMHDETFFITKGTVRFHVPDTTQEGKDRKVVDCTVGDYMVVPVRAPHTFSNPTDEESRLIFTCTPAYYINYFRILSKMSDPDQPIPAEVNMQAMAMFATIVADKKPRKPE